MKIRLTWGLLTAATLMMFYSCEKPEKPENEPEKPVEKIEETVLQKKSSKRGVSFNLGA